MGCDEAGAKPRQVRNKKLLLNRVAWHAVKLHDKSERYIRLSKVGHLTRTIVDPRIFRGMWDPMGSEEKERKSSQYSKKATPSYVYKTSGFLRVK
jgi:hypothetical protein